MARFSPWLWALVGALFGVGFIAILSIGWGLILLGVILAVFVGWKFRERGLWAILIGFGLAPAAFLLYDIATAPPPCPTTPVVVAGGTYTCGGPMPDSYIYLAIGFLAIAVFGALIPLVSRITRALRSNNRPGATGAA